MLLNSGVLVIDVRQQSGIFGSNLVFPKRGRGGRLIAVEESSVHVF